MCQVPVCASHCLHLLGLVVNMSVLLGVERVWVGGIQSGFQLASELFDWQGCSTFLGVRDT